jgi:hypothetical protein
MYTSKYGFAPSAGRYRNYRYLPEVEKRLVKEFPEGMQQGITLKVEWKIGFENGCYESWCYRWIVRCYPFDLDNKTKQSGLELKSTGSNCLEDELDQIIEMHHVYMYAVEKYPEKVESVRRTGKMSLSHYDVNHL